jgi:orotidine-5'-phosphate decarboxylase
MSQSNITHLSPKERILIALDVDNLARTTTLVEALSDHVGGFKVGLELLNSVGAPQVIQHMNRLGGHIFADVKLHDIPQTVGAATRALSSLGIKMINVHASCGKASMEAAVENKGQALLLAVTVLTSLTDEDCIRLYGKPAAEKVLDFAKEAHEAGVDGLICAASDLEAVNRDEALKSLIKVTPGIRPEWAPSDDQKRMLTPREAIVQGADYLVIGRPILNPPAGVGSPLDAIARITEDIQKGLEERTSR